MLELYSPFVLNGGSALTFCIMPYGFTLQKPSNGRSLGRTAQAILAALRADQPSALRFKDPRLYDDPPAALLATVVRRGEIASLD